MIGKTLLDHATRRNFGWNPNGARNGFAIVDSDIDALADPND
jgi:hypothetical protein